jgi:hypothetical protein
MRILLIAALVTLSLGAGAADRTYAVLSFVGDRLLIAQTMGETGSRIDRNVRQFAPTGSDQLDKVALRAVKAQVGRADAARFQAAAAATLDQGGVAGMVPVLQPELRAIPATHWILVTKHRGDARLQMYDGTIGTGQLEGLGFYIDRFRRVKIVQTGAGAEGILAPFAYLHFALIDATTGVVLRELDETMSMTAARQTATHPWDALTADEKVGYLETLIRRAADDAVPKLLSP